MLLGTIIIGSATTIVTGGLAAIAVAGVLGFGIGGVCGSYIKRKYKDKVMGYTPLQRAMIRAHIMMKLFPNIKDQCDKDTQLYLFENIIYEGEKILSLSDKTNSEFEE